MNVYRPLAPTGRGFIAWTRTFRVCSSIGLAPTGMISGVKDEQRLGRAAFLGVTVAGLSSLVWGRSAWEAASGILPAGVSDVLPQPTSGWRMYTVAVRRWLEVTS